MQESSWSFSLPLSKGAVLFISAYTTHWNLYPSNLNWTLPSTLLITGWQSNIWVSQMHQSPDYCWLCSFNILPWKKGLMLLYRVQFVGWWITPFPWQLLLWIFSVATGNINVAPTEVSAGFQIRATGTIAIIHRYSRRQEVGVLGFEIYRFSTLAAESGIHPHYNLLLPSSFPHLPLDPVEGNAVSQTKHFLRVWVKQV